MKFQVDRSDAPTITGYGPGWLMVGHERHVGSAIVQASGEPTVQAWPCQRFEDLSAEHFARLAELDAEVLLFGSGQRNRFVSPAWLAPLMARRIGVETMDTLAACRTYNILAMEGRRVVAALLLEA